MTAVEAATVHRWLTSTGDARIWICPRRDNTGHAAVLKLTSTDTGRTHAITLTHDDLRAIARDARAILAADHNTREQWIDQAADAIAKRLKATAT